MCYKSARFGLMWSSRVNLHVCFNILTIIFEYTIIIFSINRIEHSLYFLFNVLAECILQQNLSLTFFLISQILLYFVYYRVSDKGVKGETPR